MSRRRWFDWHSWAGVFAGLLMFVVCWSGTVATLAHEIDWLVNPALRVEAGDAPVSWGTLAAAAQAAHPDASVGWIGAPLYPVFAAEVVMSTADGGNLRVYVDPYTGQVTGTTTYFNVQRFFRSFHMSLFDWGGTALGYYLVCALSLVLLASLITSLVFYRRWWRGFFTLKTGKGARVFWSDSHKLLGVWSLWFVAVIAVTGGWYLFEMARYQLDPAGSEGQFSLPAVTAPQDGETLLGIDALVARAQALRPALQIRSVYMYEPGALSVEGQDEHLLVRDRANAVHLERRNGKLLLDQRADQLNAYWRWSDTADPLHFGNFAGLPVKLLWALFGLLLSGLSLTGAYLHYQRLLARGGDRSRALHGARRASTVVAVCVLAFSVGGGFAEIGGYGVPALGTVWEATPAGVWAFLAGWLAVTLGVIGVWIRKLG